MSGKKDGEAEVLFNLVKMRYGDRLNLAELEEVRKSVETIVEATEALRSVKLENRDEPQFIFKPYRKEK